MPLNPSANPVTDELSPVEQINRVGVQTWEWDDIAEGPCKVMPLIASVSGEMTIEEWTETVSNLAAKGIIIQQVAERNIPKFDTEKYRLTGKITSHFRLEPKPEPTP